VIVVRCACGFADMFYFLLCCKHCHGDLLFTRSGEKRLVSREKSSRLPNVRAASRIYFQR
jgi:hypothetical protein